MDHKVAPGPTYSLEFCSRFTLLWVGSDVSPEGRLELGYTGLNLVSVLKTVHCFAISSFS